MTSTKNKVKATVTWWVLEIGNEVSFKGQKGYVVTSIGRNNGENTVVYITLPTVNKARRVRIKDLSWN